MMNRERFGRRLAKARTQANLHQSALADRIGVSVSTLRGWERGRFVPSVEHLVAFAVHTHTSAAWLLEAIAPPPIQKGLFPDRTAADRARQLLDVYADLTPSRRASVLTLAESLRVDQETTG